MSCIICQNPTPAATCPTCIAHTRTLLHQAPTLLALLTDEAAGATSKPPTGWSTGAEAGPPSGINLGAVEASRALTQAVGNLAAALGVGVTSPLEVAEHAYKLAWSTTASEHPIRELHTDLALAVRTATRLVDRPPEIITHGRCPVCAWPARAPSDRTEHTCQQCQQVMYLPDVRETLTGAIHEYLGDGAWVSSAACVAAANLMGYELSQGQVAMWAARGKFEYRKRRGGAVYPWEEVLHQVELRHIRAQARLGKAA